MIDTHPHPNIEKVAISSFLVEGDYFLLFINPNPYSGMGVKANSYDIDPIIYVPNTIHDTSTNLMSFIKTNIFSEPNVEANVIMDPFKDIVTDINRIFHSTIFY